MTLPDTANDDIEAKRVCAGCIGEAYLKSEVTRIGHTSVTVQVEVFAERFQSQGQYVKVTEASLTYVAIDEAGRPRPIPPREQRAP